MLEETSYGLRERKHARTKVALAQAFVERMADCRFDDISIKDICAAVEVSEGTFFNYFSEKIDVIEYYLQLNNIWAVYAARLACPGKEGLALVEAIFGKLGQKIVSLNIAHEFIAAMLRRAYAPKLMDISALEKSYAFPGCPGIENIKAYRLSDFFRDCITAAVKNNEFKGPVDIDDAVTALMVILNGVLCTVKFNNRENKTLAYYHERQLSILWKGLGRKE